MTGPAPSLDPLGPVERARLAAADPAREFGSFFLSRFLDLGISYDDEARTCQVVLPYAAHLCNPQGTVHGGIIATAMDISMGHLCHRFLATAVTVEMQLRFFRPLVGTGRIEGRLLRPGPRVATVRRERRAGGLRRRHLAPDGLGPAHTLTAVPPTL